MTGSKPEACGNRRFRVLLKLHVRVRILMGVYNKGNKLNAYPKLARRDVQERPCDQESRALLCRRRQSRQKTVVVSRVLVE